MSGTIEYMMKHPEIVEQLPKEGLEMLLELVRAEKMRLAGCMPRSAVTAMTDVVDDKLMRDIVQDLRKLPDSGGFLQSSGAAVPKERGGGWRNPPPLEPPSGVKHIDRIAEHFAQLDKVDQMEKMEAVQRMRRRI